MIHSIRIFITTFFSALTRGSSALDNAMGSLDDLAKVGKSKTEMMVTEQEYLAKKLETDLEAKVDLRHKEVRKANGLDIL